MRRAITGFTLLELLIAVAIAVVVLGSLLSLANYSLDLEDTNRNLAAAFNAARGKAEEIRNTSFDSIIATFNNQVFDPSGFTAGEAKGRVTAAIVTGSDNNLIDTRVAVCWRQRGGRIMGEDNGNGGGTALDGQLNGGEDANGNGLLDSPCVLNTAIRRTQ